MRENKGMIELNKLFVPSKEDGKFYLTEVRPVVLRTKREVSEEEYNDTIVKLKESFPYLTRADN